ncbi:tRNA pseudouridine(55) synthase TruB [Maribacter spongiicola]|uniref:tRNA pseudouridine(55) synthase TruB n=1 Tax=Maribacter spongiicola TaxID=1206753 RepID=UPI003F9AA762
MKDLTKEDYLSGQVLLIDKPLEWSSFQAVNKLKWAIRKKFSLKKFKIGHAGTLDPLATGLLIICTGKFTKKITEYQGQEKEYTGVFTLGGTTASYDLETEVNETFATDHITPDLINTTTQQFIGDIEQAPPVFSALKQDGKRLYELAREGKTVVIPKRKVNVSAFDITDIDGLNIHFRIACSKGTYIRSIAHDFGKALNSGAHLTALRRTKIGDFNVDNAQDPLVFAEKLLGPENNR